MHPDALAAGLRRELERFPERADAIKAELERVAKLPRPAATPEDPQTRSNPLADYLRGLERELARAEEARHADIKAEIARVKAEIRSSSTRTATAAPQAEKATANPTKEQ